MVDMRAADLHIPIEVMSNAQLRDVVCRPHRRSITGTRVVPRVSVDLISLMSRRTWMFFY